jgi:ISXO2-like transposase domain
MARTIKKRFYVYLIRDPRPGKRKVPIYVGKGNRDRAFRHVRRNATAKNPMLAAIIVKCRALECEPPVKIVARFETEAEAFRAEKVLILKYGRKLMASADDKFGGQMGGHVEIDETLVGGKRKASEPENKTIVFGMLQRGGRLLAAPVPDVTIYTVEGIINENIPAGTKISTDEHRAHSGLKHDHGAVNHSAEEYVRGEHHVNSLESHWSLFKRAVRERTCTFPRNTLGST